MISLIIGLVFLILMLGIGFKLIGLLLAASIWLFIKIPLAFIALMIGIICCGTLILIPVGIWFFKTGFQLIVPGCIV